MSPTILIKLWVYVQNPGQLQVGLEPKYQIDTSHSYLPHFKCENFSLFVTNTYLVATDPPLSWYLCHCFSWANVLSNLSNNVKLENHIYSKGCSTSHWWATRTMANEHLKANWMHQQDNNQSHGGIQSITHRQYSSVGISIFQIHNQHFPWVPTSFH